MSRRFVVTDRGCLAVSRLPVSAVLLRVVGYIGGDFSFFTDVDCSSLSKYVVSVFSIRENLETRIIDLFSPKQTN